MALYQVNNQCNYDENQLFVGIIILNLFSLSNINYFMMKILVCISSVPDTTSKINFIADNSAFDTDGIQFIINPYDEFVLTKAIKLREQHGGTVTVAHGLSIRAYFEKKL